MLNAESLPLGVNVGIFAIAAALVWYAGTKLARYADRISTATGTSKAFVGLILLGIATSLPEIVSTATASLSGNAQLAVNNLFGGVSLQIVVLAVADVAAGQQALTYFAHRPQVLMQAALLMLMLAVSAMAIALGEPFTIGGLSLWTPILFLLYVASVWLVKEYEGNEQWHAEPRSAGDARDGDERPDERLGGVSATLIAKVFASVALVLLAGVALARTADAIGQQTGIGSSVAGAVLLAGSTSLPEVSTTVTAVRMGNNGMAMSNIFGTNLLEVGLLFVADAAYLRGPVLQEVGSFSLVAALLAIVLTAIYMIGMIERRDRRIWRLGLDSFVVVVLYAAGVVVLYQLR